MCRMSTHIHELMDTRKEMKQLEGDTVSFDWAEQHHVKEDDFYSCAAVKALERLLAEPE